MKPQPSPVYISSAQNPRVKQLLSLQQKSSERRKTGLFVVEGRRELHHCVEAGLRVDSVFCCPEMLERGSAFAGPSTPPPSSHLFEVSPQVYEKIAWRGGTEGIVATVEARRQTLDDLPERAAPLYVVLESVEKPGNLGAILRTADAAGADAVLVCDPLTDLYNPNLIRSSVGACFTVPCVACSSEECIAWLQRRHVDILTAQLQDSSLYYDTDMRRATALVMGTEATGLSTQWRQAASAHVRIPMLGRLDSLNVSVSAAILLFEAVRQRRQAAGGETCPAHGWLDTKTQRHKGFEADEHTPK